MLTEKTKLAHRCLLGSSLTVALLTTGCRSGMPGAGMFGMRSQPSQEAIAAAGPSTNYPTPPSASATPEAIASIAGGTVPVSNGIPETVTAQVAGINVSPGFATPAGATDALSADPTSIAQANPAGSTNAGGPSFGGPNFGGANPAAAQANGFGGSPDSAYPLPGKQPSGYAFGSKTFTPKTDLAATPAGEPSAQTGFAPPAPTPGGSSYALSDAKKPGGLTVPNLDSIGLDPSEANPAASPAAISSAATSPAGGFTLPDNMGTAVAAASSPPAEITAPDITSPEITVPDTPPGGFTPPGMSPPAAESPDFSTASLGGPLDTSTPSLDVTTPSDAPTGYAPGSIGSSQGYPGATGSGSPSTNGTIFR